MTITAGITTTYPLPQYDLGGSVKVSFKVRNYSGSVVNSTTDSIVAYNTGMTSAATFGTPGGTQYSSITASPLFPFTSPDSFYAGSCTTNNPGSGAAIASVNVPANGTTSTSIQLPALYVTVKNGSSAINGADVTITDTQCKNGYKYVKRNYTTNSSGQLSDPGLPWGTYDICATTRTRPAKGKTKAPTITTRRQRTRSSIAPAAPRSTSTSTTSSTLGGC